MLVERGLLTPAQLEEALAEQSRTGDPLGQILLARGWVRALDFYRVLAEHFGLRFVNLLEEPPDGALFDAARLEEYARCQYLPWRRRAGTLWIAVAEPSETLFEALREQYGENARFVVTSRFDILWTIQRMAGDRLTHRATLALWEQAPEFSARIILSWGQWIAFYLALTAWAFAVWWWTSDALLATNAALTFFLTVAFLLRVALVWRAWRVQRRKGSEPPSGPPLPDAELPVYSILVPLY